MSKPARRDGTPERNENVRDAENYISNARPARHQHVADRKPPKKAGAQGNQKKKASKSDAEKTRLQKVLAAAGVASRRMSEKLIEAGRVEVNGTIVTSQGMRVDPENDVIRVDGVRVIADEEIVTFALNKPRGIHSTMHDEFGRPCLYDLVGERIAAGQRLFHVGRLDAQTEGLLLLTNDGELANRLMHPRYEISKTYLATVLGEADRALVQKLKEGVDLEDGIARADYVQIIDVWQGKSLIKLEIHEGRKHIVRRMLKEAGFPVQALVRTKVHTVQLGEQKPGTLRALNRSELTSLYNAVQL
ncbi:MAG: rRNA pseudouridine synthase [Corynebacterium sp.]|uniref:Pseudouridine synthase n=1 Tax=Candidatus Corynebacterium faecigallinarum TaxID=2838528 RepID=A0A9D2TQ22_9CORY|nr:pseudouridine synthase [Corynebacterium sp.]HJC84915.1 rRNA pseudouridine synthase [Candidatus Corynebacterium faecigallinarum]MDN5724230.1 rRNA pseudouridine synthase [Corynebacterium sp.]MDN6281592.1 rRNA pseudouridine synthase [Corynebacterium sp.]MDN6305402.1 rRNA pseudouridine synthase [Corynebacterium sp.]MDN6352410.1 rRNA pseudouridine synthase [Corynebacterium sp.]